MQNIRWGFGYDQNNKDGLFITRNLDPIYFGNDKVELKLKKDKYIIIGTGGFAEIINNQIPIFDKIDQNLTLDGMRIIYNLNKK